MGQPGQGNPYNTGMAGPRGFGSNGQMNPGMNPSGPAGGEPFPMDPRILQLLQQLGIQPNGNMAGGQQPMGQGQAGRSNLSQFAMRAPNQGGMGTGQQPPNRMGNMGGGFGLGPPVNSNARQNYNLPQNGGGFSGPNEMGHPMGGGPLASTGMGMQRPSNPMPSMLPSAPPAIRMGQGGMEQAGATGGWSPVASGNTGITGGMNRSYQPQMRGPSQYTGGGGSFGMGG